MINNHFINKIIYPCDSKSTSIIVITYFNAQATMLSNQNERKRGEEVSSNMILDDSSTIGMITQS
jgi:hypothetical protein